MNRATALPYLRILTVLICLAAIGSVPLAQTTARDTGGLRRLNPGDGPEAIDEFLQEADSAPYIPIDPTMGLSSDTSIAKVNDLLAVAYVDGDPNNVIKLWYDDGAGGGTAGDDRANGSEIRTLAVLSQWSVNAAISVRSLGGRLAVAYSGDFGTALSFWYDDGLGGGIADDGLVNGSEVRTLTSEFQGGGEIELLNGRAIVVWKDDCCGMRLWADDGNGGGIAGDLVVNGLEVRSPNLPIFAEIGNGKFFTVASGGTLAVSYWTVTGIGVGGVWLWVDDGNSGGIAGDLRTNGGESRALRQFYHPLDWWTAVKQVNGQFAITFQSRGTDQDLVMWLDDGGTVGDGVAGDVQASPSEFRTLISVGNVGTFSDIAQIDGQLAVSTQFVIPPQLKMWIDDGNDGAVPIDNIANGGVPGLTDPPESRGVDQPLGGGGFGASIAVYDPDPLDPGVCDHLAVAHVNFCNTCGYANDLALHLTKLNILAPRGLFINDPGNHLFHDPVAVDTEIDITLRWFNDGADDGEVFIGGDVTGPNTGVWIPFAENLGPSWPDFMTLPVSLTAGDGNKDIFLDFRNGICLGSRATRSVLLDSVRLEDPRNLLLEVGLSVSSLLDWDDVVDPELAGYNVYRATDHDISLPGGAPDSWTLLTPTLIAPGTSSFEDTGADFSGGVSIYYYYITAEDLTGGQSSFPPGNS